MKTFKKVLIIIYAIIIAVGMFMLVKNGLNYSEKYNIHYMLEYQQQ